MKTLSIALVMIIFGSRAVAAAEPAPTSLSRVSSVSWQPYSTAVFARAKAEHKLVILDLEAVWCHWCHVMENTTYADPQVRDLLAKGYIAVRVDQDARPDLANRYEDYGWPATVIYDADGQELVKFSGYIPPLRMRSLLAATLQDPTPGPSITGAADGGPAASGSGRPGLPSPNAAARANSLAAALTARLDARWDPVLAGLTGVHKYLDPDAVEWLLLNGPRGAQWLTAELVLIDPAWGGVYQYSDSGDWSRPHFEKIMSVQSAALRCYSEAYARTENASFLRAASVTRAYMNSFLRDPSGAYYTSQNADVVDGEHAAEFFALGDAARRRVGMPRVDRHIYSNDNGLAIRGLCALYAATGDAAVLADAVQAANWVVAHRALPGGGFSHDAHDEAGPYLSDTLQMGLAFLDLHGITGEAQWLTRATDAASFISSHFSGGGTEDENVDTARFANLLWHYAQQPVSSRRCGPELQALAQRASTAAQGRAERNPGGMLLVLRESSHDPVHITIVGKRDDAAAQHLWQTALAHTTAYRQMEWLEPGESGDYPNLGHAAAYVCTNGRCSRPYEAAQALAAYLSGVR
jgi:uncharacterized protein YyaL (SSP411 family)